MSIKLKYLLPKYSLTEDSARSKRVDSNTINQFLNSKKDLLIDIQKNGTFIYRGSTSLSPRESYYSTPSISERKSSNTTNQYTMIIDHMPNFSSYPKRSRSLICSTRTSKAASYSQDGSYHIVIPIKDAKVAMCPEDDIWNSFYKTLGQEKWLAGLNSSLEMMYKIINDIDVVANRWKNYMKYETWSEYLQFFHDIDTNKQKIIDVFGNWENDLSHQQSYVEIYLKNNISFFDYLQYVFDPKRNGFKLINSYNSSHSELEYGREVWLSEDCYLIDIDTFGKFIRSIQ